MLRITLVLYICNVTFSHTPSQWPGKGTAKLRILLKSMRQGHELFGLHLEGYSPPVPNNGAYMLSLTAKYVYVRNCSARRSWRNEHTSLVTAFSHVLSVGNNAAITTKRCLCNAEKKVHHNFKYCNSACQ